MAIENIKETNKGTIGTKKTSKGVAYYLKTGGRWYRLHTNRPWTNDMEYINAYNNKEG